MISAPPKSLRSAFFQPSCAACSTDQVGWESAESLGHGDQLDVIAGELGDALSGRQGGEAVAGVDLARRSDRLDARGPADVRARVADLPCHGILAAMYGSRVQSDTDVERRRQAVVGPAPLRYQITHGQREQACLAN